MRWFLATTSKGTVRHDYVNEVSVFYWGIFLRWVLPFFMLVLGGSLSYFKGKCTVMMIGSKCAYTCHLSNKTTRKSLLLGTPQIWLVKVSKKTGLSLGIEADITGQGTNLSLILIGREISVAGSDCQSCF